MKLFGTENVITWIETVQKEAEDCTVGDVMANQYCQSKMSTAYIILVVVGAVSLIIGYNYIIYILFFAMMSIAIMQWWYTDIVSTFISEGAKKADRNMGFNSNLVALVAYTRKSDMRLAVLEQATREIGKYIPTYKPIVTKIIADISQQLSNKKHSMEVVLHNANFLQVQYGTSDYHIEFQTDGNKIISYTITKPDQRGQK